MQFENVRRQIVAIGNRALAEGIVHLTAGNFSQIDPETRLIAISPSGIPYPDVVPEDIVIVDEHGVVREGTRKPSSETPMHTRIYRDHPHIGAIVHTHSHYSTVVGCIREELPAILTETACVVGPRVPVSRFGKTATDDIAGSVGDAIVPDCPAVLMRNHGLIAFGDDLDAALMVAQIVEEASKVYVHALAANGGREPNLVPTELIPEMRERFRGSYGQ